MFCRWRHILCIIGLLFTIISCRITKNIPPGKKLLVKNEIKGVPKYISADDLEPIIRQKPNRKILFFKFNLWMYYFYKPEKVDASLEQKQRKIDKKNAKRIAKGKEPLDQEPKTFKSWITRTIGEPPVLIDTMQTRKTCENMSAFMKNKGYFYAAVDYEVIPKPAFRKDKAKKAKVIYKIHPGPLYIIDSIGFRLDNRDLAKIILSECLSFFNLKGKPFDLDRLDAEREKFAKAIKNSGYYYFSKDHIYFEADTSRKPQKVDLYINVKKLREKVITSEGKDTIILRNHRPVYIGKIYVKQQYDPSQPELNFTDTLEINGIYFIQNKNALYNPKAIAFQILMKEGELYNETKHLLTYSRLNAMKTFRYVNIRFEEDPVKKNVINCFILLSPAPTHSVNLEVEGYNSGGFLGTSGNINYQNRNLFGSAEILNLKFKGGIEAQPLIFQKNSQNEIINNLPFNTFEYAPQIDLEIPRFLLPMRIDKVSQRSSPKTRFSALYNYQQRPDYQRTLTRGFLEYSWNETDYKKHTVTPFEISLLKLNPDPAFQAFLDTTTDLFIVNTFRNQLIPALKYSFIYNTQSKPKMIDFWFIRTELETAGNLLQLYSNVQKLPLDEQGSHKIFGIRYSQYVRAILDLRYYFKYPKTTFAYRFFGGIGIPYGNVNTLPFEKNFFAGGANGIKAWQVRTLGPGSMPDSLISSPINRLGNVQLEGNFEFRFPISGFIKGAYFIDVGNIWQLKKDPAKPNAEFAINRLWRDLAIGSGIGIRLDFDFFLIRFDFGVPFKNPNSANPYQIKPDIKRTPLSLGIGYPF